MQMNLFNLLHPIRSTQFAPPNSLHQDVLRWKAIFPGESAVNLQEYGSLSPGRTDEECRQNGRRSDCPISSQGKVPLIRGNLVHFPPIGWTKNAGRMAAETIALCGNLVHFPPIGRTRNAGRMAAEAIVLFHPGGKCLGFMENWCTFPSKGQTFPLLQESEVPATGYL